jgi:hypothetical protein
MASEAEERWKRLAALGVQREIPMPEGEARMSAVILQLAEPLLKQHDKTPQRAEAIIMLTIAAWNKSIFPPENQPLIEKDLINSFVPKDGNAEDVGVAVQIMDMVIERRESRREPDRHRRLRPQPRPDAQAEAPASPQSVNSRSSRCAFWELR